MYKISLWFPGYSLKYILSLFVLLLCKTSIPINLFKQPSFCLLIFSILFITFLMWQFSFIASQLQIYL